MDKIIVVLWLLFGVYFLVIVMILADLWSGVRKAKKNEAFISSYGFRRTVEKMARYYNILIALTVIDAMQMGCIWYLEQYYGWKFPLLPIITILGAIGLCLIEVKSIYEKAEDKKKIDEVINLSSKIYANRSDIDIIIEAIVKYIKDGQQTDDNGNSQREG